MLLYAAWTTLIANIDKIYANCFGGLKAATGGVVMWKKVFLKI